MTAEHQLCRLKQTIEDLEVIVAELEAEIRQKAKDATAPLKDAFRQTHSASWWGRKIPMWTYLWMYTCALKAVLPSMHII